jgi:ssRNA-specific RNase YbeY (16S rRNA maturation enzyme)
MVHGVLHYCGYKDKGEVDELLMRPRKMKNYAVPHG